MIPSIEKKYAGMTRAFFTFLMCVFVICSYAQIVFEESVQIPEQLRITPNTLQQLPLIERQFMLSELGDGDRHQVFLAPPCMEGNFYVAVQLYHDLGDHNTDSQWSSRVDISMLYNGAALWQKPLAVSMETQTLLSTAFHSSAISCDQNYEIRIDKISSNSSPEDNIYVRILLFRENPEPFEASGALTLDVSRGSSENSIRWNYDGASATEYDVEWVFVDASSKLSKIPQQIFKIQEPVRVTATTAYFNHSLIYPAGKLFYRVRPTGLDANGKRIFGDWVYSQGVDVKEPVENMSWRTTTQYTDNGQFEKSVEYIDGEQKERQHIVLSSDAKKSVASEFLYDFEGRLAVEVIPAPLSTKTLKYQKDINKFDPVHPLVKDKTSAGKYTKYHYDNGRVENSVFSSESGASKYYSTSNEHAERNALLPDAQGYVYKHTTYSNDPIQAGRVAEAGKALRADGGHTLNKYVGSVGQEEAIRLFGSEGLSKNLKKELTVDADKKATIRYINDLKQCVVEAEVGNSTSSSEAIVVDLLQGNRSEFIVLNAKPATTYSFSYALNNTGNEKQVYDIELNILSPSGLPVDLSTIPGNDSPGKSFTRHNVTALDVASLKFDLVFDALGEYTVTRKITRASASVDEILQKIQSSNEFVKKSEDLVNQYEYDSAACAECTSLATAEKDLLLQTMIKQSVDLQIENYRQAAIKDYQHSHGLQSSETVSLDSLKKQPQYAVYQYELKNAASNVFDKSLALLESWEIAEQKGMTSALDVDPFFNNNALSGYGFKDLMKVKIDQIVLATLTHGADTIEYKGSLSEIIDPSNKAFYVNANGQPDAQGGIHPLYIDLLSQRNRMTKESFETSVSEKRWQLYRNYYLQAKQEVVEATPDYKALPKSDTSPTQSTEQSPELYSSNSIAVMEWAFNKKFTTEDKQSIAKDLGLYFKGGSENFLHVILRSDLKRKELVSIQSVLNKYGCDLGYIAQDDELGCVADDIMDLYQQPSVTEHSAVETGSVDDASVSAREASEVVASETTEAVKTTKSHPWGDHVIKSAVTHQGDYKVLLSLYKKLDGSNWKENSGWKSASEGDLNNKNLYGVITNAEGRVVALKLQDNNLSGVLPDEIGNLNELQYLDLGSLSKDGNKITGKLPSSLGNLTKLVYLNLSNNNLNGELVPQLYQLTNVRSLNLNGNHLTGSLSSDIEKINSLTVLNLSDNNFKGSIPSEVGKLNNLKVLDLSRNEFSKSIPASIGNLSHVTKLDLSFNKLEGEIPSTFSGLKNVQYVRLNNNALQRSVPSSINSLKKVVQIDLSFNNLSGNIPTLTNLHELQHLVLSNNQLASSIPVDIASLPRLKSINLSKNALEGKVPQQFFESSSLEYLDLSSNMLSGEIPVAIGNSNKLVSISLDNNKLTGSIPSEIGDNSTLAELKLQHNELIGALPEAISSMKGLRVFQAGHNKFEGKIPSSFGNMSNLEVLLLEANSLTDTIPAELANASRLRRIDFSENKLTGPIPVALGNLSALQELALNNNKLTGQLPPSLNRVPRVVVVNNRLEGTIPFFAKNGDSDGKAVWLSYNKYSFENILPLTEQTNLTSFLYQKQDSIDDKKVVPIFVDHPFELIARIDRNVKPACHYRWFKYVDGVKDEPLNEASEQGHTVRLKNVTTFDESAKYYYTITNKAVPGLTLVSNLQTVMPLAGNSLCVKFNPLKTFVINGSKNEQIAKWEATLQKERNTLARHDIEHALYREANTQDKTVDDLREEFTVSYVPAEDNYTLHYFDAFGNVTRSVTDGNIHILTQSQINGVMRGEYKTSSQDGEAKSLVAYNKLGQLRLRQHAHGKNLFTYFRYDAQGREIEHGDLFSNLPLSELLSKVEDKSFPGKNDGDFENITKTLYDNDSEYKARFARGKVVRREFKQSEDHKPSITTITYDGNGYVQSTVQHDEGYDDKVTAYRHDPLSGKLTFQFYQNGALDEFSQHYVYNASGKLKEVRSSTDGFIWNREAAYSYYDHGALKQLKLGEFNVQSVDYYYTIQGWLKGINTSADNAMDATDAYAITLGYYNQDFKPISGRMETSLNPKESFTGEISWNTHDVHPHQKARQSNSIASVGANRKVYDANGQLLASYVNEKVVTRPIYGVNQIGIYIENNVLPGTRKLGAREFSLTNHKHEPLVIVSDNVSLNGKVAKPTVLTGSESQKAATGKSTEGSFTKAKN